jgi:hypothetical protein
LLLQYLFTALFAFAFAFQVRNAIQVLQELATSNSAMATRYPYPLPAHSNPNLPDNSLKQCNVMMLPRSSSHPPEIFCWENSEPVLGSNANFMLDKETQTDELVDLIEQYILQNPHRVLLILGLDADAILGGQRTSPPLSAIKTVQPSDMTIPANNIVNIRNHCSQKVMSTSINQPTDWIAQPPPAPSFWQQQQQQQKTLSCQQHHHRFSAGDIDDKFRALNPLPATRSLKFQPFSS